MLSVSDGYFDTLGVQLLRGRAFTTADGQPIRSSSKRLRQDLQRDIAVELRIRGTPHFAHPAFTEFGGDCVMPGPCADAKRH